MFDSSLIKTVLKEYVDKNLNRFGIYPFGINGVCVRNILKDYFNLEACLIVDDEISKYNAGVIDQKELVNAYESDIYIILTIENMELNAKLYKELSGYIPQSHIINLYKLFSSQAAITNAKTNIELERGFRISDFLPVKKSKNAEEITAGKIKVRISHRHPTCWNVIKTIYQAFDADSSYDVLIVISNRVEKTTEATKKQIQELGYPFVIWSEYKVEEDRPDIMILTSSYDCISVGGSACRKYAKLIVMAFLFLIHYNRSLNEYWELQKEAMKGCYPDYYLYDSLLYQQIKNTDYFSEKIVEMGNAKFDEIYQTIQEKHYPGKWEKLRGKKVILWATSHGIWDKEMYLNLTFDLYAKVIFRYIKEHPEVGVIFRPHGSFLDEMLACGFWCKDDIERLRKYCDDMPNLVFDDTDTYKAALSIADGIMTDAYCGVVCSSFPTLKPICAMYRTKKDAVCSKELLENCYSAFEERDVIEFMDMVKSGLDPLLGLRKQESSKYVKNFDGKNGWRIKKFIEEKYFEMT